MDALTEVRYHVCKRLYDIAEQQAGYFTTAQAQEAGFSPSQLTYVAAGGLAEELVIQAVQKATRRGLTSQVDRALPSTGTPCAVRAQAIRQRGFV